MLNIKYYLFIFLSLLMILGGQATSVSDVTAVGERTPQVRDVIVSAAGVNAATDVTDTDLAEISSLDLRIEGITELKSGDFSGLTGLTNLNLYGNQLSSLPEGIFEGLTALTSLRLGGNTVDPLPLTIGLEKVAEGQFRAAIMEGAPFDIVLPINVTNGTRADNAATITIPKGSMVSETITVNRPPNSRLDATADIGDLPNLPRNHYGYVLSKSATLPIVTIIGNVVPVFTNGVSVSVSVDENTEAGTNIGTPIMATDVDEADTLTYTLGGIDADAFDIDSETGQLKTKAAIDYETKFFYSVTMTVSDGLLTDTITVTINVIDVLDNFAPTFTEGAITVRSVAENTEADENIGTPVTAVDTVADSDTIDNTEENTLTYSLGGIDVTSFDIDTETGQLKTKASLDFERKPFYVVKVTASDGQLTDTITVIISLIDLTDTEFVSVSLPLSERTPQVRDAIVDNVVVANNLIETPTIDEITDAQIAAVTVLNLHDAGITKLKSGDFSGMPNLTDIYLHNNMLMGLPAGIFEGLTALTTLRLDNSLLDPMPIFVSIQQVDANQFRVLVPTGAPFDITVPISVTDGNISGDATTATVQQGTLKSETFTIVPAGETPIVDIGKLPGLPRNHYGYVLARSTACNRTPELVSAIETKYPLLMHCQNVADVDLAVITHLNLVDMGIRSLRTHDFSGMLALTTLYLNNNELTYLPKDLFDGLVSLKTVSLRGNKLTQLPDGIFEGFVSLVSLDLSENAVEAIPLTVSLEKVGEDGFKAVIPAGAPFNMTLTLTATNGTISDDIDTITIPQGRVESDAYIITRIPNTLETVTVDISELPDLPALHAGYELVKSDALPLEILPLINVPPMFTETTPTTYTIPENTEEGINIGAAITALDANNDTLFYTLSGEDADAFEINPYTGQLTTKEDLDFETKSTYTVIVTASDGVNTVSITVTINVANVDENRAPIFTEGTNTTRSVVENTIAGTNIGDAVVATDPDEHTLTYSLAGTDAAAFSINTETGQLRTEAPLDYETNNSYAVIITATDGELTASIDVAINIIDVAENPPVFTQGTATTITITTETEQAITATDVDGDTLIYSLSGEDAELFDIDPDTGELKVKEGVTLDPDKTYKVTVTVSDGVHTTSIDVNIHISDITDEGVQTPNNAPVFTEGSSTTRNVDENTGANENIGDPVTASDDDNDTLTYSLGGDNVGSFNLDTNTGQLITLAPLDFETTSFYTVEITAFDSNGGTATITVTINVNDVDENTTTSTPNRAPTFTEGTNTIRSVAENTTAGTNIGDAVVATDPDDDTLTYSLEGTDVTSFSLDTQTGQLRTYSTLDYETKSSYSVMVTATDGEFTASIDVAINIIDVAENPPVFSQGTTTTITITTETEQAITATDADGDTLTYSLSGDDAELFDIDPNTGELEVKEDVTLDPDKTYKVTVTVSDGTHNTSINVNIKISDVTDQGTRTPNNAPVFKEGTSAVRYVAENTQVGTNVGTPVSATDQDTGDTLTYRLSTSGDAAAFTVVQNTGQLKTGAVLDYETKASYSITVVVSDGEASDTIDVTINITNDNDPPVFTPGYSTSIDVLESVAIGTEIGTYTATDQDSSDTLIYSLSSNNSIDHYTFEIDDDGILKTDTALDYETKTLYEVIVSVSDEEVTDSIDVTINVTDIDEGTQTEQPPQPNRSPVFSEGTTAVRYVPENTQVGTNVGTRITATDQDAGDTLTYRISTSGDATAFSINTNTGQLITSAVFDYETKSSYSITVIVSDGEASDTIGITINVTNDNDPPVFTPGYRTRINVPESASIGRELSTYTATDQDSSDTLIYSLSSNNSIDHNSFEIGRDDGILKTSTALDYETKTSYVITVSVSDGNNGTDSIKVTIHVTDVIELDPPISSRTPAVRNAIVAKAPVTTADDVTKEHLENIKVLYLDRREITSLKAGDFNGLTQLTYLTLAVNNLTTLPAGIFDDLSKLGYLNLSFNDLSSLPNGIFNNLTALEYLYLAYNELSSLSSDIFANTSNLIDLYLEFNNFSSLPLGIFDNLSNLKLLYLYNNELSSLPAGLFEGLSSLEKLWLSDNELTTLPSGLFDGLTEIKHLNMHNNELSSLPADIFDGLTTVIDLTLDNNELSSLPADIFDGLTAVILLTLHNNKLTTLPAGVFDGLTAVSSINLEYNELSSLPVDLFGSPSAFKTINLAHNDLNTFPLGIFDNLSN